MLPDIIFQLSMFPGNRNPHSRVFQEAFSVIYLHDS